MHICAHSAKKCAARKKGDEPHHSDPTWFTVSLSFRMSFPAFIFSAHYYYFMDALSFFFGFVSECVFFFCQHIQSTGKFSRTAYICSICGNHTCGEVLQQRSNTTELYSNYSFVVPRWRVRLSGANILVHITYDLHFPRWVAVLMFALISYFENETIYEMLRIW